MRRKFCILAFWTPLSLSSSGREVQSAYSWQINRFQLNKFLKISFPNVPKAYRRNEQKIVLKKILLFSFVFFACPVGKDDPSWIRKTNGVNRIGASLRASLFSRQIVSNFYFFYVQVVAIITKIFKRMLTSVLQKLDSRNFFLSFLFVLLIIIIIYINKSFYNMRKKRMQW